MVTPKPALLIAALLGGATPVFAQSGTGILLVTVRADSTPLAGAFVRAGRVGSVADARGLARLELPGGRVRVFVSHAGYRSWDFEITIVPNAATGPVEAALVAVDGSTDAVVVRATRTDRKRIDEPATTEIVAGRSLIHAAQLHGHTLTRVLDGAAAVRAQPLSGPLGATPLRIRGLPGDYLTILLDGLPLTGSGPRGFIPAEFSLFDLSQVELVTGPANALQSTGGLAGLLNLVSRRADRDTARVAVEQTSEKGGGARFWGAKRFSATAGATMSLEFQQQRLVDADDDQWGEFPRAIRVAARPRLFIDRPNGDALFATIGAMSEDRNGGFLASSADQDPYREERRTRRFDGGLTAKRMLSHTSRIEIRFSGTTQSTAHRFNDLRERDRRWTIYADGFFANTMGRTSVLLGAGFQRNGFRHQEFPAFGFIHDIPTAYAQATFSPSASLTGTLSGRCESYTLYGLICTPRISLLGRPAPTTQVRVAAGAGYRVPTPNGNEVEVIGLRQIVPTTLRLERGQGLAMDVEWNRNRVSLDAALAYSRIGRPVRLVPYAPDPTQFRWLDLDQPARIVSGELTMGYRMKSARASVFYAYLHGTEGVPNGTGRREIGHAPRHRIGFGLVTTGPASGTWAELRGVYTGDQSVWDNPFRTRSPAYTLIDVLVSQPFGRARLYAGGENLFDVKMRDYEPIVFNFPTADGRRTAAPWVPLQGRVITLGAILEW